MKEFKEFLEKKLNEKSKNFYSENPESDFPFPMGPEAGYGYMLGTIETLNWVLEMFPEIKEN